MTPTNGLLRARHGWLVGISIRGLVAIAILVAALGQSAQSQSIGWGEYRGTGDNGGTIPGDFSARWDVSIGQPVRALSVSGGILLAGADHSGQVSAIELRTGRVLWRRRVPTSVHNDPAILDSTVIVTFGDLPQDTSPGGAWAFDLRSGRQLWRFDIASALMPSPALVAGVIVLVASDECVHGLEPRRGKELYRTCFGMGTAMSSPKRLGDMVVFGTTDGHVVALDGKSGVIRWIRRLPLVTHAGDASIAVQRDAIFVTGTSWGGPISFMRDTSLWTAGRLSLDALVHDRFVDRFVSFSKQRIFRLAPSDGAIQWTAELGSGRRVLRNLSGTPAIVGDLVVVSSPVGVNLTALWQKTGRKAWVQTLPARHRGAPTIVDDDVIVGLESGLLVAYNARTGKETGRCTWPAAFTPASPLIVGRTFIYGATDGILRAVPLELLQNNMKRNDSCLKA